MNISLLRPLFITLVLAGSTTAVAQTSYLESVRVENRAGENAGKEVRVSMDINLDGLDMHKQHTLRLVPTLVSADGTQNLPLQPVEINGKIRNKVVERRIALGKAADGESIRLRRANGKPQTVHYEAAAPFRRWMVDGRLELRADVTGCADCREGSERLLTGTVLPYTEPAFLLSPFEQPVEETVKRRSEVRTARLQYRQDSHNVLPRYKNNRAELDKVFASIDAAKSDPDLTITGIYITGYASPEASAAYNLQLSERRARRFMEYVQRAYPDLDPALWHVSWKGEDWEGLRQEVEKRPGLLKQDEVLRIIDQCSGDPDACEERIKALVPPEIYQRVLNEMYGPLRRNEYRIEYNVRHFDLKEAQELVRTRPDLLSVAEIQKVADSYGTGSPAYIETLQVAARTYPGNRTAQNNCALALIEAQEYTAAIALLKGTTDGALLNLLGVAYAKAHQYDEAKDAFNRAKEAGYAPAKDNLQRMEEAIALFN